MEENIMECVNENINLNIIYTWLSQIEEINYMLYIRLLNVFDSIENLYVTSKEKNNFKKILVQNNIILSKKIINKLTSFNLKEKSYEVYNNLIKQNINIIHIDNKNFPKNKFRNMYNLPICLFVYGDINKLNEKNIYLHKESFNKYGDYIYEIFDKYINDKKWNRVIYIENLKECGNIQKNIYHNKIFIINEDIYNVNFKLETCIKNDISNLYVFYPNKMNSIVINKLFIIEYIVSISNLCIIPQAKYDKNMCIKTIVDLFLEQEKNVLVVPGNIYCEFSYFSNYLIKEGAEIVLNKHDIDKYL